MTGEFSRGAVSFRYPTDWQIEIEDADDGWTATLQGTDSTFLLVCLRPDADDPLQVADEALAVLQVEYKELDATEAQESIAGRPAVGHDIDFLTLDVTVTCRTRVLDTTDGPLLLMSQMSDHDRPTAEPVVKAVWASLRVEDE
jgi:hypothetical protein